MKSIVSEFSLVMNASTLYIYSDGYEVTMLFFFCWYL